MQERRHNLHLSPQYVTIISYQTSSGIINTKISKLSSKLYATMQGGNVRCDPSEYVLFYFPQYVRISYTKIIVVVFYEF